MAKPSERIVMIETRDPDGEIIDRTPAGPLDVLNSVVGEGGEFVRDLMHGYLAAGRLSNEVNAELREELREHRAFIREVTAQHIELTRAYQRALSEEHERKLAEERARDNAALKSRVADEAIALAGPVARALAGIPFTEGMPEPVASFLRNVRPEQVDPDTGTISFDPGQFAALMMIMQKSREEEEARDAKREAGREKAKESANAPDL